MDTFTLTSEAFAADDLIPTPYTREGENSSPPLSITNTPDGTMSLAITVEDPDIPQAVQSKMDIAIFDHWVAFNIPPSTKEIPEGSSIGTQGTNSGGELGYTGPCPPAEHEPVEHRYIFTVFALDTTLDLPEGATKEELRLAMQDHTIATAELVGRYRMQVTR